MNRLGLTFVVALACGCDSTRTPVAPSPQPSPSTAGPFSVTGVVTDSDSGRPLENVNVIVGFNEGQQLTTTAADGRYALSFSSTQPYRASLPNVLGLLIVWPTTAPGSESEYRPMVQEIPRGANQIVQNVRLRPARRPTAAGDSTHLFIDPDSSLAFDWEYAPWELASAGKSAGIVRVERLWEWLSVSPVRDGVLTVDVRPEGGGSVPFVWCDYVGCPGFNVQGPVSIAVRGGTGPFVFKVEIPRGWAPQRYVVTTSLQ